MRKTWLPVAGFTAVVLLVISACSEQSGSVPEVPAEEISASIPELSAVHDFMQPLWHDAFPEQDYGMIQEMVPQFEPALEALDGVELPGILQDKQADWDTGKAALMSAYEGLRSAAETGNEAEMLSYSEAFHGAYEGLVRLIRPPAPEVEAFHQHLYALYHHYGPGYDLEKIRTSADNLAAAIPPLQNLELPERLADHQAHYEMVVSQIGEAVGTLIATLNDPNRDDVDAAINAIHDGYTEMEGIFSGESSHE
jgi:hypothetical protein